MKDDESLIEDLKKMSFEEVRSFVDNLILLKLPVKTVIRDYLQNQIESNIINMWNKRRIIMVNGMNAIDLNYLLKKNKLFDQVFANQVLRDIRYFEENNIIYINLEMKYLDVIEDYLRNGKFNFKLIKEYKRTSDNYIDELINELKMVGIELNEEEEKSLYHDIEPSFVYRDGSISQMDVELVKSYPGSYMYKKYMSEERTAEGDVLFDCDGKNDELIVKYMKDDKSLEEDLKKMSFEKIRNFIDDLDFLNLPIKKDVIKQLGCNDDYDIMEAWRNRLITINDEYSKELNTLLKENNCFDIHFDSNHIENSQYYRQNNIFFTNLKLKYLDVIEDYLKNGKKINRELVKRYYDDGSSDELFDEMMMMGIELKKEDKEVILDIFDHRFLHGSAVVSDTQYDGYLREWLGDDYKWKMIYRASEHRYTAQSFHECCDYIQGPTLIVIKSTNGCIFGGYTTQSWSGDCIYYDI